MIGDTYFRQARQEPQKINFMNFTSVVNPLSPNFLGGTGVQNLTIMVGISFLLYKVWTK